MLALLPSLLLLVSNWRTVIVLHLQLIFSLRFLFVHNSQSELVIQKYIIMYDIEDEKNAICSGKHLSTCQCYTLHYFIFHFRYIGCGTVRLTDKFCRFSYLHPRFFRFLPGNKSKVFFLIIWVIFTYSNVTTEWELSCGCVVYFILNISNNMWSNCNYCHNVSFLFLQTWLQLEYQVRWINASSFFTCLLLCSGQRKLWCKVLFIFSVSPQGSYIAFEISVGSMLWRGVLTFPPHPHWQPMCQLVAFSAGVYGRWRT